MNAHDPELKKELSATLQARKDLGEEYESALVDSFMDKLDQRLNGHVEKNVRRELAQHQTSFARTARGPRSSGGGADDGRAGRYAFAAFTLAAAIPLSAIGAHFAGGFGLLVTWAGIVGVNVAQSAGHLFGSRSAERNRTRDEWDG